MCNDEVVREDTLAYLHVQCVQEQLICTVCAPSLGASAGVVTPQISTAGCLVGPGGQFVPPTAAPFPDGVGDGLVC